jgi:hypothetical protein
MSHRLNLRIAHRLREMADLLDIQGEVGFRSKAYRSAADVVELLERPVDVILSEEGRDGLVALPAVGFGIASAIAEMVTTGRWSALERLTGKLDPEELLMTVPGIGRQFARRLHEDLHIESLEELEQAIADGRVGKIEGFRHRRLDAIQATLRDRLQLVRGRVKKGRTPPVDMLLDIDTKYRQRAENGELRLIAPRRFNPKGLAWLPVMHDHRKPWHFTVLYSNTARAHELNKSRDWVVIFVTHDREPDWQCTVVTETHGPLKGKRVIRGMEVQCEKYYAAPAVE